MSLPQWQVEVEEVVFWMLRALGSVARDQVRVVWSEPTEEEPGGFQLELAEEEPTERAVAVTEAVGVATAAFLSQEPRPEDPVGVLKLLVFKELKARGVAPDQEPLA